MKVLYLMSKSHYTANCPQAGRANPIRKESWSRTRLFFRNDHRIDIHSPTGAIEAHIAIDHRKNCVIAAKSDVFARQELGAALANDDVPGHDHLAAKSFYAQSFADAVAAILNAALSFFMSH
jgi:hypothetical protein